MKCHRSQDVHRLVDDELDAAGRSTVERHVAECANCGDERRRVVALRHGLRDDALRHALPASLLARVTALVEADAQAAPQAPAPAPRRRTSWLRWYWLGSGAVAGAATMAGVFTVATALEGVRIGQRVADEAVAAHGRAATTDHLVDVRSSDRHNVRPWLSQHLDYSPPVPDLRADGFTLLGGRIDRLDRTPVATLVYGYGQHTIDVFVRPSGEHGATEALTLVRGFNVMQSSGSGMDLIGVSDVNATQLAVLMQRLAAAGVDGSVEPRTDAPRER